MKKLVTVFKLKVVKCNCGANMIKNKRNTTYKCPQCSSIYTDEGKLLYAPKHRTLVGS